MAEIRLDVDYPHPVGRVWRALTEPRILDRWFIPGTFGTTVGAHYQLRPAQNTGLAGPIDVEVLEAVEAQRLVMQWTGEKLHSEMTWVLMTTAGGARLSVVQTGFLGTPQSVRRTELRQAYTLLFMQSLPLVLDQLADGEVDLGGAQPVPLNTAIPRVPRPGRGATASVGLLPRFARGWPVRWRMVGTLTAVLAMLALAVIVLVVGLSGDRSRSEAQPLPQPLGGTGAAIPASPEVTVGRTTHEPTAGARSGAVPVSPPAGASPVVPGGGPVVPPATTGAPTEAGATVLAARYETTRVAGVGSYTGEITISADGPGTVTGWAVVITLNGSSKVTDALDATFAQSGQTVTFHPLGNAQVSAASPVSFTFHVNRREDTTTEPLTCTIDGRACGS